MMTSSQGSNSSSFLMLLGRICICIIFILAGIGKFMDPNAMSLYMASKGMPLIPFFLYASAIIEVVGGTFLLFGFKTRITALVLLLFLIPVTVIFHGFWDLAPPEVQQQMVEFLKNLAIFGGLLYTVGTGAGKFSIDHLINKE